MSKKPRKTGKEKETAQSSVSIEKAQKVQDKNEERRIRQEEERKSRNISLVQNGLHVRILNILLSIYVFLLLVGTPLYVHKAFHDIGTSKWRWYEAITFGYVKDSFIVLFPGFQIIALALFIWYVADAAVKGVFREIFQPKKLTVTDWCVAVWMVWCVLSAILAKDKETALSGFFGWYMGVFAQLSFGWLYFLVSRFLKGGKKAVLYVACCITGVLIIAGTIGVLHRHGIDAFWLYENTWGDKVETGKIALDGRFFDEMKTIRCMPFLSTIGQQSWYGMWLCPVVPIAAGLFCYGPNTAFRLLGLFGSMIGAMGIATSSSANAIAGMGVFLLVFCWDAFRNRAQLTRFIGLLFAMCASWQFLHLLLVCFPEREFLYNEKMNYYLFAGKAMPWITIALGAVFLILFFQSRKNGEAKAPEISEKGLVTARNLVFGLLAAAVLGLGLYIALNTAGMLPEALRSNSKYLVMDIHWGQYRMEMWVVSLKCFFEKISADPSRLFFGMGPDSMYLIFQDLSDKLQQIWLPLAEKLDITDSTQITLANAHNEWLTMFINLGIVGGLAYAGLFVTAVVSCFRRFADRPALVPCAAALCGYVAGVMFTHQEALAAPAVYTIMAVGMMILYRDPEGAKTS